MPQSRRRDDRICFIGIMPHRTKIGWYAITAIASKRLIKKNRICGGFFCRHHAKPVKIKAGEDFHQNQIGLSSNDIVKRPNRKPRPQLLF